MKNRIVPAGFALLPVLLVILVLLIAGGGAYTYYNAQQNEAPQVALNQQATTTVAAQPTANTQNVPASLTGTAISAAIDQSSLTTSSGNPVVTGTASGMDSVTISFGANGYKTIPVVNGKWSIAINHLSFPVAGVFDPVAGTVLSGSYQIDVFNGDITGSQSPLAKGMLTVKVSATQSSTNDATKTITDTVHGFQITVPASWTEQDNTLYNGDYYASFYPSADSFAGTHTADVTVIVQKAPVTQAAFESGLTPAGHPYVSPTTPGLTTSSIVVQGASEGRVNTFTQTIDSTSSFNEMIFLFKGGQEVQLQGTNDTAAPSYLPIMKQILQSFSLI